MQVFSLANQLLTIIIKRNINLFTYKACNPYKKIYTFAQSV